MAPKRHRLDINALNAISVTVYQRSPAGDRYLLKTCVCSRNRPIEGNWNCRPCRVRTRKKLGGRDASRPARIEIKVLFRHPINPTVAATQGLLGHAGNAPIEKYYYTSVGSDQSREYSLNADDYTVEAEVVEPTTLAIAGLPGRRSLTQVKVPRDVPEFRGPTGLTGGFQVAATPDPIIAGLIAETMADGSSVETPDPGDQVVSGEEDQGLGQELLFPAAGAAAGLAASGFLRITPLVGGLLGAVGGYFLGQDKNND